MDSPLTAAALEVKALSPALGAAITGVDLGRDLNPATVTALIEAWHQHLVLVFPGQALEEDDQIRVAKHFGEIQGRSRPGATVREAGWGARGRMKDASSTDVVVHAGRAGAPGRGPAQPAAQQPKGMVGGVVADPLAAVGAEERRIRARRAEAPRPVLGVAAQELQIHVPILGVVEDDLARIAALSDVVCNSFCDDSCDAGHGTDSVRGGSRKSPDKLD